MAQEQIEPQMELCQHPQTPPKDLAAQPTGFDVAIRELNEWIQAFNVLKH